MSFVASSRYPTIALLGLGRWERQRNVWNVAHVEMTNGRTLTHLVNERVDSRSVQPVDEERGHKYLGIGTEQHHALTETHRRFRRHECGFPGGSLP